MRISALRKSAFWNRRGLTAQVMSLCIVLVAGTSIVLGFVYNWVVFRSAVADAHTEALVFGRIISQNAEPFILLDDKEALIRLARNATTDVAIRRCIFTNAAGVVVATESGLPTPGNAALTFSEMDGKFRPQYEVTNDGFTLALPIMPRSDDSDLQLQEMLNDDDQLASPEALGFTMLEYTFAPLRADMRGLALTTSLLAIGVICVVLIATRFLMQPFLRPIHDLVATTSAIAGGDLTRRATEDAIGEIGELARSFNHMASRLEESYASIEQQVQDRTHELARRTIDLEAEVANRKKTELELIKAKDVAEAASKAKSEFLANMSHELRTPLNGVIGMTELLLASGLQPRQMHFARTAKLSADTLLSLISDILDLSKVESGKLEIEHVEFNLIEAVESVVDLVAHRADPGQVELACFIHPEISPVVRGDPGRLQQVLLNLANNAIKFTEAGNVTVTVLPESADGDDLVLRVLVKDTGIGIPADRLDCLFKPFSQVDASTTRKYGGTGLGLRISKQLVELMGGEIGVTSKQGEGSEFWFTVKLGSVDQPAMLAKRLRAIPSLNGLRVLIVDDNGTNREILMQQLSAWGLTPEAVCSADEALVAMRRDGDQSTPFGLAILDMHMPGRDGADLGKAIKADPVLRNVPLIMLTSMTDDQTFERLKDIGFAAMISKPAKQSRLFDAILKAVDPAYRQNDTASESYAAWATPQSAHRDIRLLLVEDNRINQEVAANILETAGYPVDIAANGKEALSALEKTTYALVLMDCQMPTMDGFEATRRIREQESRNGSKRIPIVALTANALQGDRGRCLDVGMDDYLTKPLDPVTLLETINRLTSDADSAPIAPAPEQVAAVQPPVPQQESKTESVAFDVHGLLHRCPGGPNVVSRILHHFGEDAERLLSEISSAREAEDLLMISELAHALKGAAGNLTAEAVAKAALDLEIGAKSGQRDLLDEKIQSLRASVDEAVSAFPGTIESLTQILNAHQARGTPN